MNQETASGAVENEYELGSSNSISSDLEEGEVLQNSELVCVDKEDMERIAAEEERDIEFSCPDAYLYKLRRRGQDMLKYHVVSCQEELEELRKQNEVEDAMIDPKDKLHLVKYVKMDGRIVKLWECGICAKDFRHQYTLMRHLPTHTDERKYTCDVCNKSFRQMSTLSQHRAIHSNARPYVCEVCQKTFNRVSTLISHRRTHFDDKPHKCHVCGKGFHQKGNLKNHVFSHTNERPYRCELCGRGFNQMSNLVVHKLKSHGQSGHVTTRHDEAPPSPDAKFVCHLCGHKFVKRNHLLSHEEKKHNLKPEPTTLANKKSRLIAASEKAFPIQVEGNATNVGVDDVIVPGEKSDVRLKEMKLETDAFVKEDRSTSGLLIDAIETPSMQEARNSNQNAFALLKSIDGTPSLVKIFDLPSNKQLLIPATAEDLAHAPQKMPKSNQVKVTVVATVIQQMDDDGQLVVRIEPTVEDQKLVTSSHEPHESGPSHSIPAEEVSEMTNGERIQFVRPLPDGGFEIISEEEAASFLEIVDGDNHNDDGCLGDLLSEKDGAQIIISQDENGQLLVEGTPLQLFLETNDELQNQQ